MDDSWFCDDALRTDPPPGGWLLDDGTWRAGHARATVDRYPHFHLWLVPWWEESGLRGPRYLVESLVHADGCSPRVALRTANEIKRALTDTPQAG